MSRAGFRRERLGPLEDRVNDTLDALARDGAVARLWSGDHTLWSEDPTEISDRLGWLHVLDDMEEAADHLEAFVCQEFHQIKSDQGLVLCDQDSRWP